MGHYVYVGEDTDQLTEGDTRPDLSKYRISPDWEYVEGEPAADGSHAEPKAKRPDALSGVTVAQLDSIIGGLDLEVDGGLKKLDKAEAILLALAEEEEQQSTEGDDGDSDEESEQS